MGKKIKIQQLNHIIKHNILFKDGSIKITQLLNNKYNLTYPMDIEYPMKVDYHDEEYIKFKKKFVTKICPNYKKFHSEH